MALVVLDPMTYEKSDACVTIQGFGPDFRNQSPRDVGRDAGRRAGYWHTSRYPLRIQRDPGPHPSLQEVVPVVRLEDNLLLGPPVDEDLDGSEDRRRTKLGAPAEPADLTVGDRADDGKAVPARYSI